MSAKKLANLKTLFNSKLINFKTKGSFFLPLANRSHISAEGCNQKRQRRSDTYFCAWPRTHSNVSLAADHCSANGNILTDFLCTRSPAHIVMQRRPLLKVNDKIGYIDWTHYVQELQRWVWSRITLLRSLRLVIGLLLSIIDLLVFRIANFSNQKLILLA